MILGVLRNPASGFHVTPLDLIVFHYGARLKSDLLFTLAPGFHLLLSVFRWRLSHFAQGFPSHTWWPEIVSLCVLYSLCVWSMLKSQSRILVPTETYMPISLSLITSILSYIDGNLSICSCLSLLSLFPCHLQDCHCDPLVSCPKKKKRWQIAIL